MLSRRHLMIVGVAFVGMSCAAGRSESVTQVQEPQLEAAGTKVSLSGPFKTLKEFCENYTGGIEQKQQGRAPICKPGVKPTPDSEHPSLVELGKHRYTFVLVSNGTQESPKRLMALFSNGRWHVEQESQNARWQVNDVQTHRGQKNEWTNAMLRNGIMSWRVTHKSWHQPDGNCESGEKQSTVDISLMCDLRGSDPSCYYSEGSSFQTVELARCH